jgi:hypothetical protein
MKMRPTPYEDESKSVRYKKLEDKTPVIWTAWFLYECKRIGINIVAINDWHELIPSSVRWAHEIKDIKLMVFAEGKYGNWPAIWRVVEVLGIGGGCGNRDQHQIRSDSQLISGVYKYITFDTWEKIK